jgi:hypothetical protein
MKGTRCETCGDFTPARHEETPSSGVFGLSTTETLTFGWDLVLRNKQKRLDFCSWACLSAYAEIQAQDEITISLTPDSS